MTTHRSLAAALWLLAAAVAFAVCSAWAGDAQSGKVPPWALVAFFWSAAGVSVAIHYLSQGPEALRRYRLSLAPADHRGARLRDRVWRPTLTLAPHRLASGPAFTRRHLAARFALVARTVEERGARLRNRVWRPTLAVVSHRLASGLAFMRRHLAGQFALIAGIVSASVQRPHPVDAVGPGAGAEALGNRLELVGQVEAA